MNLQNPKKFKLLIDQAHQVAINVLRPISRKYDKAEPLYLQALAIRKEVLGENHPDYANSLNSLAILYDNQRKYDKAEILYIQALNIQV